MKRKAFMFLFLFLFLFSGSKASGAVTDRPSNEPVPSSKNNQTANETIFKWEGRGGFMELKSDGDLYTPFGVFTRAKGGLYPKWYGRDGFIILKNHRLQTPYGLYRPYYY